MESGVYAAPIASWVKTVFTGLPFRSISYRFPSSLFEKTVPFTSTAGALTHHSNELGWSEMHESVPSLFRWQLFVFVFCQRQLTVRSGGWELLKSYSGELDCVVTPTGGTQC